MRRLGLALLVLAASPAYAERPIDGWDPGETRVEPRPDTPIALIGYNKIYLNRCASGCPIAVGTSNAITDRWQIGTAATLTKFPYSDDVWNQVVSCVKDVMSPYNIDVVTANPGSVNHFEIMIAGMPTDIGFPNNVGGVAPPGCNMPVVTTSPLVFDFAGVWGQGTQCGARCVEDICATAAQEVAHTWGGMDHVIVKEDPMTYFNSTGRKYFQDTAAQCGSDCVSGKGPGNVTCSGTNNQSHVCRCTGQQTQNSVSIIKSLFGTGPGTPPTVTFTKPMVGTTVQAGFKVTVTATDDVSVAKVDLKIDGMVVQTLTAEPYTFTAPTTVGPGSHHIEAIAYDGPGTPGSAALDVTVAGPCETAADCPSTTDVCIAGRCAAGPNATGGLGTTCSDGVQCASELCVADSEGAMYCVEPCVVGQCPEDFGCIDDGTGRDTGVCWPGYDDGSGGCGCESNRPGGALSFGLLFAVTVFTWRRRRSSVS
jgi:MYXO-CTERM domain-containing protein